jgi:hypothetical protein
MESVVGVTCERNRGARIGLRDEGKVIPEDRGCCSVAVAFARFRHKDGGKGEPDPRTYIPFSALSGTDSARHIDMRDPRTYIPFSALSGTDSARHIDMRNCYAIWVL